MSAKVLILLPCYANQLRRARAAACFVILRETTIGQKLALDRKDYPDISGKLLSGGNFYPAASAAD